MTQQSFLFVGRSGAGKGTQAALLIEALKKLDPSRNVVYLSTGQEFREFIKGDSYTQKITRDLYNKGGLQPEFMAIYMWVSAIVNRYAGNEHFVFDGMARKIHEAVVLDSVFDFYNISRPWVIDIEVSSTEAMKRLLLRNRSDDKKEEIEKRLGWYETEVAPSLEFFRKTEGYRYLTINGERPIEEIHEEILKKVTLA